MLGFQIGIKDIIDILLVAILLYQTYRLLKKSGAENIFAGIIIFIIIWYLVAQIFRMELLGGIFDRIINVGAFALIVLFQDEIRRFFSRIGSKQRWSFINVIKRLFGSNNSKNKEQLDYNLMQVVLACRNLSRSNTGALIVITKSNDLEFYVHSGDTIDANINSRLIENIFFKNSPLHDGALIISNGRLKAAGCILPVSRNPNIPKNLGLRHRAATGITEQTDAIAVVVSEETGYISWVVNGVITSKVKPEELEGFLSAAMNS